MQLTDYLTEFALQVNSQCLRAISAAGTEVDSHHLGELRVGSQQLRAMVRTIKPLIASESYRAHVGRLRIVRHLLADGRDRAALQTTLARLIERLDNAEQPSGRELKLAAYLNHALATVDIAEPPPAIDQDELSVLLQTEARGWREVTFQAPHAEQRLVARFVEVYGKARSQGARALMKGDTSSLRSWRHWAGVGLYQLDAVRPRLSEINQTRRWYLEKLNDGLVRHRDLRLVGSFVDAMPIKAKQRQRLTGYIAQEQSRELGRVQKLFPQCYGQKPKAFLRQLSVEVGHAPNSIESNGENAGGKAGRSIETDVIMLPPVAVPRRSPTERSRRG